MFNLNNEIAIWRKSILETETCTAGDLNELESHLLEEIDQLKTKDLSEQEAFLVAASRIGKPATVAEEFAKVNQSMVMRNRIFMACTGVLAFLAISSIASFTSKLIQLFASLVMPKIAAYVPAYMQIFFQLAIFAVLVLMVCKLAKKGKLSVSMLPISVVTIIVLLIAGQFVPAVTYRMVGAEVVGRTIMVTGIFRLVWSLAIPIILAVMIKKFRQEKPAVS
jgi:hypothetical protein